MTGDWSGAGPKTTAGSALPVLAGGYLVMGEQAERAEALFRFTTGHANDLGLLAEEADLDSGAQLGNTPQAFSHVGLINAA